MTNAGPPLRMSTTEWGLLLALSVIWGGSFFFVEIALTSVPPFTIVLSRVGLAALTLYAIMRLSGLALPASWSVWRLFVVLGLINTAMPFSFLTWGQSQISGGLASILNATTPLFTIVVAHYLTTDERLTRARVAGVILGVAGVTTMIGQEALKGMSGSLLGQLSCLGAPICYAFGTVQARKLARLGLKPLQSATGQFIMSTLFLAPVAAVMDAPWTLPFPGAGPIAALSALALASTTLAYLIYFRILNAAGATNIQLVTFLVPATAIALGIAFLDEALAPQHLLGMAMIGLGLAAIDGRPAQAIRRRLSR